MPPLPFSSMGITIAINLMTLWFMLPAVAQPIYRGWLQLAVLTMFCLNIIMTATNLAVWLGVLHE